MPAQTGRKAGSTLPEALRETGMPNVHLKIGEGIVTSSKVLIATVLGSCVSVSFFHARTGLAGIFHAMLPSRSAMRDNDTAPCKFVDSAIHLIHQQFRTRSIPDREIEVKLFGGAFSMGTGASEDIRALVNVGHRNVQTARMILSELSLHVQREHVGGDRGRKLVFNTQSGDVWVKLLGKAEQQAVMNEERVNLPVEEGRACRIPDAPSPHTIGNS